MNLLHALASGPRLLRGDGVNHEGERFHGTLVVEPVEDARAVLLRYTAQLADGTVVHTETTLLGTGPDGRLCLWPVMSELPGVLPHVALTAESRDGAHVGVFATGPRDDPSVFREEITLAVDRHGTVTYAHAWGLPEGDFGERSSCTLRAQPP